MNNRNAKEEFMCAFGNLYEKKRIEKISVRELCELAGFNRTTFYVYFKDIYDLLEQFIEAKVLPEEMGVDEIQVLPGLEVVQNIMYHYLKKNNRYIEVILKQHHNYVLQEVVIARIKKALGKRVEDEFEYVLRYQTSAILGVLEFWYQQGNEKISDEQLLTLVYEITTKGVLNTLIRACSNECVEVVTK